MVEHPVQLRAACPGCADSVIDEDPLGFRLFQGVHLQVDILVHRAEAGATDTGPNRGLIKG